MQPSDIVSATQGHPTAPPRAWRLRQLTADGSRERTKIDRSDLLLYLGLVLSSAGMLSVHVTSMSDYRAVFVSVVSFAVLVVAGVLSVDGDISHPYVWYGTVFLAYSVAAPLLWLLGEYRFYWTYARAVELQWLCYLVFVLIVGRRRFIPRINEPRVARYRVAATGLALLCGMATIVQLGLYFASNVTSKLDIHFIQGANFARMDFVYTLLAVSLSVIVVDRIVNRGRFPWEIVFGHLAFLSLAFAITGERDIVIRAAFTYALLYASLWRRPRLSLFLAGGLVLAYISTVMNSFKNVLLSNTAVLPAQQPGLAGFIDGVFGSEFRTAGENLSILLAFVPDRIPFFRGEGLLWELNAMFSVGFLRTREQTSTVAGWFTQEFYPALYDRGGGSGFTIVGQGYVDFGVVGSLLLFAFLALGVRYMVRRGARSALGVVAYVNIIPLLLVATRLGLSAVLSQPIKHVLLPCVAIYVVGHVLTDKMYPAETALRAGSATIHEA